MFMAFYGVLNVQTGILDIREGFSWARQFKHTESNLYEYIHLNISMELVLHTTSGAL
jgi:hypothetical protein